MRRPLIVDFRYCETHSALRGHVPARLYFSVENGHGGREDGAGDGGTEGRAFCVSEVGGAGPLRDVEHPGLAGTGPKDHRLVYRAILLV